MLKRWKDWLPIAIGCISLVAFVIFKGSIEDIKTRMIVNLSLIAVMMLSFLVAFVPDKDKYTLKDILHNKTVVGAIALFSVMLLGLFIMINNLGL